jgi:hypothetical protein
MEGVDNVQVYRDAQRKEQENLAVRLDKYKDMEAKFQQKRRDMEVKLEVEKKLKLSLA